MSLRPLFSRCLILLLLIIVLQAIHSFRQINMTMANSHSVLMVFPPFSSSISQLTTFDDTGGQF